MKDRRKKQAQLEEAVLYCTENNCKGYAALSTGRFPLIKDPRTINRRIEDKENQRKIKTGDEKAYCRLLTKKEEESLVKYLINKNRCRQGVTHKDAEGVVLNILRTRKYVNRRGGRKAVPLNNNAKKALEKGRIDKRRFFTRLMSEYPKLRCKSQRKVSVKRGLRCTREMAIEHLDELAELLIETGIAHSLEKVEGGVWEGDIDTSRIWAHDETPQFINYNTTSNSRVFAESGGDCEQLSKENRECVTVHPFSNLSGDQAMCQVIFSSSGHSSNMCPVACENIPNLLISVNDSGCSDHYTLNAAYKQLIEIIDDKSLAKPSIVIADGHKSRMGSDVMTTCSDAQLEQFLLPPDTSGSTQLHDQVNQKLHAKYEEKKSELYSEYSDINREGFMTILGEIWAEWVTPEQLIKAAKRVGISKNGLNVNWMDQSKFAAAEATLNPPQSPENVLNSTEITSPVGTRKNSSLYWRKKFETSLEKIDELNQTIHSIQTTTPDLEAVPGLMPYRKVVPKNKNKFVTKKHGTLKATDVRKLVEEREKEEQEKNARRETKKLEKENQKVAFSKCFEKCHCEKEECAAINLKKCPVCLNVLKTQCNKKDCKDDDGKPPKMMIVAAKSVSNTKPKKMKKVVHSDQDSDEDTDDFEDEVESDGSDISDEEFFAPPRPTARKICILFNPRIFLLFATLGISAGQFSVV